MLLARCVEAMLIRSLCSANNSQASNMPDDKLIVIQKNLYALRDFLDRNPQLFHSSPGESSGGRAPAGNDQEAWKVRDLKSLEVIPPLSHYPQTEQQSVAQLQALLNRTVEAISFVLLLVDYRLGELISKSGLAVMILYPLI